MTIGTRETPLVRGELQSQLTRKVTEVACQPDHNSSGGAPSFMTEDDGRPVVRLAATNCELDMDIWQGLRSPAKVGMYPIGLEDIWRHYATCNVRSTRADGSPNPLAMPEPFDEAKGRFRRAVIVSGVLAMNPDIYENYAGKIESGDIDPCDDYCRARGEVLAIINKGVGRLALSLMADGRAVVPMTVKNVGKVIDGTRGEYMKGRNHGPRSNHFPQTSVAVMTGLLRFGVSRLPFRDEVGPDGSVRRLMGQYGSIVIFDDRPMVTDGAGGMSLLDVEGLAKMRRANDYTVVEADATADRYCTYNLTGGNGASVCGKCIDACPVDALAHSSPGTDGTYDESLLRQKHRFWDGWLDFDSGNCCRDRGQKSQLCAEYVCARCEAVCAARGIHKSAADVRRMNGEA